MKNVTITLPEETAAWTRVEAAKAGKSMSRWIADRLAELRSKDSQQREALDRFLAAADLPGIAANLTDRDELYAERLFHRHERVPIREGSDDGREARKSSRMAKRSGRQKAGGR